MKLLLLDAMIVIDAHRLEIWKALVEKAEICLPSVVASDEASYFKSDREDLANLIDLSESVNAGEITILEASAAEMASMLDGVSEMTAAGIDPGEKEALAIVCREYESGISFCTADGAAICALGELGFASNGSSFERVLTSIGMQQSALEYKYSEKYFEKQIRLGQQRRIQSM